MTTPTQPLTALQLADALDCFWNAALGAALEKQDTLTIYVVGAIVEGVHAVSNRLKEIGEQNA